MIDEEKTYTEKGYRSTDLKPKSSKPVYAVCEGENCEREGGRGRWLKFKDYRAMCHLCANRNKPMKKLETPTEKLPWIDDEITYAEKGYRSTWLSFGSGMKVYAICTDCGEGRWLSFQKCDSLCHKCANKKQRKYDYDDDETLIRNIDEKKTFAEKGYHISDLSAQSSRKVYAVCVECGKGRWIEFRQYHDLCPSCANKGERNGFYGKHHSEKTCKELSDMSSGENGVNYGKTFPDKTREKMRNAQIGEKGSNWKGGITPENDKFRGSYKYAEWRKSVFERDDYTCQECLERGGCLQVHHILPYRDYRDPEYSLNVDNGITLCVDCHNKTKGNEYEFVERYQDIVISKKMCIVIDVLMHT